eukprot:TRINITY_DN9260_c0_g2_i2.p1 TRINITY_DN9260_c0_g2~~TRINITY_DN9260_c0_g2_i2.p1  ORF type:complete len:210 (+),score=40.68 TRINITY_DN9260_c0_g2_i2:579-1208(+)
MVEGYKVLVVGDGDTGKASFIAAAMGWSIDDATTMSRIKSVDCVVKTVEFEKRPPIKLQFWIQPRPQVAHGAPWQAKAAAVVVVADGSRTATVNSTKEWRAYVDRLLSSVAALPVMLAVTKSDLAWHGLAADTQAMDSFSRENDFIEWCKVSARDVETVEAAVQRLAYCILAADAWSRRLTAPAASESSGSLEWKDQQASHADNSCSIL